MKKNRFFQSLILIHILSIVFFTNCKKDSGLYSDPIAKTQVYKTKGDYFKFVNTWGSSNAPTTLSLSDSNRITIQDGDTIYKLRWKLEGGYTMALVVGPQDYFTDMTFSEIVSYNERYPEIGYFPKDSIFDRVIDTEPFLEYYIDTENTFYHRDSIDIVQINQIIKDGELEKYFKKVK